ncbi:MAG TPA: glycosyltransferase family 2 protein [Terriglobales bacterium]|nr:glycosyltransferase family 2 protein [Terriglobales bacterium]
MRYSLITPTLLRPSLERLCASIDAQSCRDWEHLIAVDTVINSAAERMLARIQHAQRVIWQCPRPHRNFGNTCRHAASLRAQGDYIFYLDDDIYLADENVLHVLECVTAAWAIFPMLLEGNRFFNDPPGYERTDTANFIVQRSLGTWPDIADYAADGNLVERLRREHSYQSLPDCRPLVVMPRMNFGDKWFPWGKLHNEFKLRKARVRSWGSRLKRRLRI